jgi:hypothetical protein
VKVAVKGLEGKVVLLLGSKCLLLLPEVLLLNAFWLRIISLSTQKLKENKEVRVQLMNEKKKMIYGSA